MHTNEIIAGAIGAFVATTITSVVYMTYDIKERREAANMVPIEQCIAALLSKGR